MTGKTHAAIGFAAGLAITVYGIRQGDFSFALALVSAPTAALLPDVDHNSTKANRILKLVLNVVATAVALIAIIGMWYVYRYIDRSYIVAGLLGLAFICLVAALYLISQTRTIRKIQKFIQKHRGFTHTLLIPIFVLISTVFIRDRYVVLLLYGFVAGYASHVFSDCFTKQGCPILFPITSKKIKAKDIFSLKWAKKVLEGLISS